MGKKDNPDDARNWSYGDMIRDQEELDDVHLRAYNPAKDEIIGETFITESEGKERAERARDRADNEARRRGKNISAEVKKVRGGYKIIVYTPKNKKG